MEIQFNVTTHKTFEDAVKDPQAHKELLVRVSGYTAYFKDLNPQMQQEIIDRTEYDLALAMRCTSHARPHDQPCQRVTMTRIKHFFFKLLSWVCPIVFACP